MDAGLSLEASGAVEPVRTPHGGTWPGIGARCRLLIEVFWNDILSKREGKPCVGGTFPMLCGGWKMPGG